MGDHQCSKQKDWMKNPKQSPVRWNTAQKSNKGMGGFSCKLCCQKMKIKALKPTCFTQIPFRDPHHLKNLTWWQRWFTPQKQPSSCAGFLFEKCVIPSLQHMVPSDAEVCVGGPIHLLGPICCDRH